jgi:hypothetical protein
MPSRRLRQPFLCPKMLAAPCSKVLTTIYSMPSYAANINLERVGWPMVQRYTSLGVIRLWSDGLRQRTDRSNKAPTSVNALLLENTKCQQPVEAPIILLRQNH